MLYNTYYSESTFIINFASFASTFLCLLILQRLSTSVKMVNKGVLKDHLILVANSMTCTGSLIGFNIAGYKATFRSLKVHVPFTESTLFVSLHLKYLSIISYISLMCCTQIAYFGFVDPYEML